MSETRIPTQKRSIEKRNKIIEKGFELICEQGYHNISTPDIAKAANVSTGIIYQYFNDKKDIFIEGVKNYSQGIMYPMIDLLNENNLTNISIEDIISNLIDSFVNNHTISKKAHEELMAMTHLDEDVAAIFKESEFKLTSKIEQKLIENNIVLENARERIHLIIGIVENLCHEIVYHKHDEINYDIMKKEAINMIKKSLN